MPNLDRARPFEFDARGDVGAVLLHGFTGAPQEVEPLGEALAERGVSSLGPMLPGHGSQPEDLQRCTWSEWTEAAGAALDDACGRWSRVVLGGLSMGGALALHAAAHHRHRIRGVVALAAPLRLTGLGISLLPILAPIVRMAPKRGTGISSEELGRDRVGYDTRPLHAAREAVAFLDHLRDDLVEVRSPLLLVHSRRDGTVDFGNQEDIRRRVSSRDVRTLILERSDHVITQDVERQQVLDAVVDFVLDVCA